MWRVEDNRFDFSMTQSIEAPKSVVYSVLADFASYPDFISDIVSVTRIGDVYHMVVKAAILTIPAQLRASADSLNEIAFQMIDGPVDVLTGKWMVAEGSQPNETQVTLVIHIEAGARSEWLLRMTGKFVQGKTGKLVQAFAARVEAVSRGQIAPTAITAKRTTGGVMAFLGRLWSRLRGSVGGATNQVNAAAAHRVFTDAHQVETLEALAATIIPADDFDGGASGLGFPEVAEVRTRYEAGRADIYLGGMRAVDSMARQLHHKDSFARLSADERTNLLTLVQQGNVDKALWGNLSPGAFFGALTEDVVFLYCTHPDTWQRLGWPGPAFDSGGYRDFDQKQEFMGNNNVRKL